MQILPVDLTAIVAIVLGMLAVLIPIAGLTARFALKPLVESMARLFDNRTVEDTVEITQRRVSLLESQIESLEHTVSQMREAQAFDRQLRADPEKDRIGPGAPES
jgi:TolA-binding protein